MDADTYPRPDVQQWLATTVCMKVNAERAAGHADKFGVRAFPTLVLIEPSGTVLYNEAGAPASGQFTLGLSHKPYKKMIDAFNARKHSEAAKYTYFLRKWFKGTLTGKQADETYDDLKENAAFMKAYKAAEQASNRKLAALRDAIKAEQERREKVKELQAKADKLYRTFGKKYNAYKIYKQIILEYPDLPEADTARMILRKHKQRWKEPEKKK